MRFWLQVNELLGFDIGFLEGQGCPTRVPVACFKPWFCLDHGPQPLGFIYMFPSAGAHLTILTCFVHFCAMFCAWAHHLRLECSVMLQCCGFMHSHSEIRADKLLTTEHPTLGTTPRHIITTVSYN